MSRVFAIVAFLASGTNLRSEEFSLGMYRFTLPDGFINEPGKGRDSILGTFRSADGKMRVEYSLEQEYNGAITSPADANKGEAILTPLGEGLLYYRNAKEGSTVDFLLPPDLGLSCHSADGSVPAWFKGLIMSMTSSDAVMVQVAKSLVDVRRDEDGKNLVLSLKKDPVPIPGKAGETCQAMTAEVVGADQYEMRIFRQPGSSTLSLDAQRAPRQALILKMALRHSNGVRQQGVRIAIPELLDQKEDDPVKR